MSIFSSWYVSLIKSHLLTHNKCCLILCVKISVGDIAAFGTLEIKEKHSAHLFSITCVYLMKYNLDPGSNAAFMHVFAVKHELSVM